MAEGRCGCGCCGRGTCRRLCRCGCECGCSCGCWCWCCGWSVCEGEGRHSSTSGCIRCMSRSCSCKCILSCESSWSRSRSSTSSMTGSYEQRGADVYDGSDCDAAIVLQHVRAYALVTLGESARRTRTSLKESFPRWSTILFQLLLAPSLLLSSSVLLTAPFMLLGQCCSQSPFSVCACIGCMASPTLSAGSLL